MGTHEHKHSTKTHPCRCQALFDAEHRRQSADFKVAITSQRKRPRKLCRTALLLFLTCLDCSSSKHIAVALLPLGNDDSRLRVPYVRTSPKCASHWARHLHPGFFQTADSALVCREKTNKNVLSITHKEESHTRTLLRS